VGSGRGSYNRTERGRAPIGSGQEGRDDTKEEKRETTNGGGKGRKKGEGEERGEGGEGASGEKWDRGFLGKTREGGLKQSRRKATLATHGGRRWEIKGLWEQKNGGRKMVGGKKNVGREGGGECPKRDGEGRMGNGKKKKKPRR